MNPITAIRTGARMKAAGVNDLAFPPFGGGWWDMRPRSRVDLKKAGDGLSNSAVSATVTALGLAYSEPTVREYARVEKEWVEIEDSSAAALINNPNDHIETELLWMYEVASVASVGSAFYHIVRNFLGDPIQLWPLYPAYMTPHTPRSGDTFLSRWDYQIPGGQIVPIPNEDLVHRRWGLDRNDHRRGHAPLRDVLIEVLQDQEAAMFSTALLTNLGVPGVVLSPKDPNDPGPGDPDAVSAMFQERFSGQNRGRPFVANNALRVDMVSFNPEQMDLTALRRVPEERISAILGYPAILAGLGAGLDRSTYNNVDGLREYTTESKLIPMWNLGGKQWTRQLLWDDAYGGVDMKKSLRFDVSEVRALQKDEDDMVDRMDTAIKGGWAMVSEGRRSIGLPVEDQHEVFLRNISTMAVGMTDDATEEFDAGTDEGVGGGEA